MKILSKEAILENVRRFRTIASLYRQTAAFRPDQSWSLLGQAKDWAYRPLVELETYLRAQRSQPARSSRSLSLPSLPSVAPLDVWTWPLSSLRASCPQWEAASPSGPRRLYVASGNTAGYRRRFGVQGPRHRGMGRVVLPPRPRNHLSNGGISRENRLRSSRGSPSERSPISCTRAGELA